MRGSFYGWNFKCQSAAQTLAVIPADAFRKKGENNFYRKESVWGKGNLSGNPYTQTDCKGQAGFWTIVTFEI